ALLGGFYRAGLESPHWRRPHAALGCVAGAERLLGGLDAHPAAAALIGPTRLAVRYAGTRACGTPPDDDEGGGEHRHEERHPAGQRSHHDSHCAGRPPKKALGERMSDRDVVQSAPKQEPCRASIGKLPVASTGPQVFRREPRLGVRWGCAWLSAAST